MSVSQRIKSIRKALSLTQLELGKIAGVSKQAVYNWEHGHNEPDRDALKNLRLSKKINPDYITDNLGNMFLDREPQPPKKGRKYLSSEYSELVKKYQQFIPVDIYSLAYDLGIDIEFTTNEKISGYIKLVNEKYIIGINNTFHPNRQRFTLAHELAHFFLHKELINGDGITDNILYRSFKPDVNEYEANRLASSILMPDDEVNKFWEMDITLAEFARKFQVSEQAISIKLGIPF